MEPETRILHFTVSGEYLTNFARDFMFEEGGYRKAIEVLVDGIVGFNEAYAIEILTGKKKLIGQDSEISLVDDEDSEEYLNNLSYHYAGVFSPNKKEFYIPKLVVTDYGAIDFEKTMTWLKKYNENALPILNFRYDPLGGLRSDVGYKSWYRTDDKKEMFFGAIRKSPAYCAGYRSIAYIEKDTDIITSSYDCFDMNTSYDKPCDIDLTDDANLTSVWKDFKGGEQFTLDVHHQDVIWRKIEDYPFFLVKMYVSDDVFKAFGNYIRDGRNTLKETGHNIRYKSEEARINEAYRDKPSVSSNAMANEERLKQQQFEIAKRLKETMPQYFKGDVGDIVSVRSRIEYENNFVPAPAKDISEYGWLSPKGEWINSAPYQHTPDADTIVEEFLNLKNIGITNGAKYLEDHGWIGIHYSMLTAGNVSLSGLSTATQKQRDMIFDWSVKYSHPYPDELKEGV